MRIVINFYTKLDLLSKESSDNELSDKVVFMFLNLYFIYR
jgi:hypothetical protein